MSKLRFAITRIVSRIQETTANPGVLEMEFMSAYTELRKACPGGTLHIHLYVEADSAEEVGVVYEPDNE